MSDVIVGAGSTVNYCIIDSNVKIGEGCVIGKTKSENTKVTVVAGSTELPAATHVPDGAMVDHAYLENPDAKEVE